MLPQFEAQGVPVDSLDCPQLHKGRTLYRLVRRLRILRPHVVHTHNPNPHVFGSVAARVAGVPVLVHTKHGRNYPDQWRAVLMNRLAAQFSQRVVPVSEDAAQVSLKVERVPRRKVQVIPNGIDLTRFPAPPRGPPAPVRRAIHVARLHPIKDQTTLLQALRIVVDAEPEFHLDIVGDGPAGDEMQGLAERLGLGANVRFLGYRSDVRDLLCGADLFVLSSVSEGISLTLLEAMASELAVVATDVGGNREVVVQGETGLLVPPRSPESLAAALLRLSRDPVQARDMGIAGRQRVASKFDLRRVVRSYENLYRFLLARGSECSRPSLCEEPPILSAKY